ncbi:hypothetical protein ASG14_10815 [Pedobacter sp. Leaf194]|nr:hypothetical protein ASG14_10815 [Pedobacter sp. Leaf194]
MNKNLALKSIGFLPFVIYLLATSIWKLSYWVSILMLSTAILLGMVSLFLQKTKGLYLLVGGIFLIALSIFIYQYLP